MVLGEAIIFKRTKQHIIIIDLTTLILKDTLKLMIIVGFLDRDGVKSE